MRVIFKSDIVNFHLPTPTCNSVIIRLSVNCGNKVSQVSYVNTIRITPLKLSRDISVMLPDV